MDRLTVLLDACVLFPAPLRDLLLRGIEASLYDGYWSNEIWDEVTRNLIATNRLTPEQATHLKSQLERAFPSSFISGYDALIPALTCDKKDRHVLAAAIQAPAKILVTFNLRHFPAQSLSPYAIEAQHPDAFLMHTYDTDADSVLEIVRQQAMALRRPPQTINQVLDALALHVPYFIELVRVRLLQG